MSDDRFFNSAYREVLSAMNGLQNMDRVDDIERGELPDEQPEATPSDTTTRAHCLLELSKIPGLMLVEQSEPER